jgi:hypothetical protein
VRDIEGRWWETVKETVEAAMYVMGEHLQLVAGGE